MAKHSLDGTVSTSTSPSEAGWMAWREGSLYHLTPCCRTSHKGLSQARVIEGTRPPACLQAKEKPLGPLAWTAQLYLPVKAVCAAPSALLYFWSLPHPGRQQEQKSFDMWWTQMSQKQKGKRRPKPRQRMGLHKAPAPKDMIQKVIPSTEFSMK